jgi:hypothetical protein
MCFDSSVAFKVLDAKLLILISHTNLNNGYSAKFKDFQCGGFGFYQTGYI